MLQNNIYNADKKFDYATIKAIVLKSLEKIATQALNNRSNIQDDVISDFSIDDNPNNVTPGVTPTPLLNLKIRNTTKYLNWRLSMLKRDNFQCRICHISLKDKRNLFRLEVHHLKRFKDIIIQNNITTIKQALECQDLWNADNGICICSTCHKYIENIRSTIRSIILSSSRIFDNVVLRSD
jgi:hypothetical protein